ncbi:adenosylcobinamide-GDP ribazoletransferase [Dermacoccus nishinomiyaensis]|uniref:adenosylcobinamide-GDP ribazoletransferase n=1 Tax=Dermacoccus nishinomiyaensis TaxID=1274 RepID=UPI001F505392|nr:adenosylcobinamide-GDP ribazoletransferase [Dermacoccus nishinomiyaensis]MCI0152620.1 adenosylcobinamide-GDP ribazoletransferase [Dermacoccus nishinomiyaensis]
MSDAVVTRPAWEGLRLATGTLSVIPVGSIPPITTPVARWAMTLAPLAAVPLAVVTSLVLLVGHWVDAPPLVAGFGAVAALAAGTRAMHVDGLADTVDGFGAGWNRERALEVMKRGDVGPMGVIAVVVTAGVQTACFAALLDAPWLAGATVIVSRVACTTLAHRRWSAARPHGMGAVVLSAVRTPELVAASVVGWLVLVGGSALADASGDDGFSTGATLLAAPLVASVAAGIALEWLARRATRTFGGLTGDVMGAGIEVGLTVMLIVLTLGVWR